MIRTYRSIGNQCEEHVSQIYSGLEGSGDAFQQPTGLGQTGLEGGQQYEKSLTRIEDNKKTLYREGAFGTCYINLLFQIILWKSSMAVTNPERSII